MIVDEYWSGVARRLAIEARAMNALIPHQGEKGRSNEMSLATVLSNLLPPGIGVGTGIIFDAHGGVSPQMDIVLFDRAAQPQLLAQTNQLLFPIETVLGVVEVKTTLSGADISDFQEKKLKFSVLTDSRSSDALPPFALFAYRFGGSNYGRAKDLAVLPATEQPDLACVIEPGFVLVGPAKNQSGFTPVHRRDADGNRISYDWIQPQTVDKQYEVQDGISYPIYMMGAYKGDMFLGDPGRALLIFCAALLKELDRDRKTEWLSAYVTGVLSELHVVDPVVTDSN